MEKDLLEKLNKKTTFLFDFDGTLLNSEPCHKKAHSQVLSKILNKKMNLTDKQFSKYIGKIDEDIFEMYKKDFNVDFEKDKMIQMKKDISTKLLSDKNVKIFDYYFQLKNNFPKAKFYIISNQDEKLMLSVLKSKNILNDFEKIFSMPSIKTLKQDFLKNLNLYISSPINDCVLFEDSNNTLLFAKKLNFLTIGIKSEINKNTIKDCDFIIDINK